jgi:sec-independent protein translocase protein TatA
MMGGMSIWHWLVVGIIVMLLFGRGKISEMMGDVAKGIKAFKKGMSEDDVQPPSATAPVTPTEPVRTLEHQSPTARTPEPTATSGTSLGERKVS